jgi:hypothetical protein
MGSIRNLINKSEIGERLIAQVFSAATIIDTDGCEEFPLPRCIPPENMGQDAGSRMQDVGCKETDFASCILHRISFLSHQG